MPTLRTVPLMDVVPLTDVVPAPRMPAEDETATRRPRSHPPEQYWSVFEACWVVLKAFLPPTGS
jgi:hypothetical protein